MSLSNADFRKMQEVIQFTNISSEVFSHSFAWGDAPPIMHTFEAGESRFLPFPIANHLAKHLATSILRGRASASEVKNSRAIATEERINKLKLDILSDKSQAEVVKPKTSNEILAEHIDSLNTVDKEIIAPDEEYQGTKADIIADLQKAGITYNPRDNKTTLIKLLEEK